jgi:hypothetical protein
MKKAFRASRLMGLFVLALGVMAFSATAAQAELGAFWSVNKEAGKPVNQVTNALNVRVQAAIVGKHAILLTKVGLSKVEILCTTITFVDALLKELGGATGKIHFEGPCVTLLNGAAASACVPHSPGAANGLIETNALDGLIKLHTTGAGTKVDLFELLPTSGSVFVTLILGKAAPLPNECAIGEKFDITGTAFLKESQEEGLVERTKHEFEEGPLSELFFGANHATIDGKALASLAGTHAGFLWSGLAS